MTLDSTTFARPTTDSPMLPWSWYVFPIKFVSWVIVLLKRLPLMSEFLHLCSLLQGKMVIALAKEPSARLLKHVVRCYLRLSDNQRYNLSPNLNKSWLDLLHSLLPPGLVKRCVSACLTNWKMTHLLPVWRMTSRQSTGWHSFWRIFRTWHLARQVANSQPVRPVGVEWPSNHPWSKTYQGLSNNDPRLSNSPIDLRSVSGYSHY